MSSEMSKKNVEKTLGPIREKIDTIDDQIVRLLSERQKQVANIVDVKKKLNLPVYHPAREENLISLRRELGERLGLDPDFVEELFRCMLQNSRKSQTRFVTGKSVKPGATVLIVGGGGNMGNFFYRHFIGSGYNVRVLEKDQWDNATGLCQGIDLAMVCTPIEVTPDVIKRLGQYLPEHAVLCDITSIKVIPLQAMLHSHPGPVIGLHPLFGETTHSLDKQLIVATPGRMDDQSKWILEQLGEWGCIVITCAAEKHDEIMDVVQALRHFASFAFGKFLYDKSISIDETLEFSSPIYRLELDVVGRLFAQSPALYSEIIFATNERRTLMKEYIHSLQETLSMIDKNDKNLFIDEFTAIADWFGKFGEQAIRESSFLIDKLVERF